MGMIINYQQAQMQQPFYRLSVYVHEPHISDAISISKLMADEILLIRPRSRSLQMEKCFLNVLEKLPENPFIKDIDVMFNPAYAVDVLQLLVEAYKQKKFSLIWPGTYRDGCLIYAEEGYSDYKTFSINDYDIVCLI